MRITTLLLTSLLLCSTAGADLIVPQTFAPRVLVPAAGSAAGQNGTFFRSDIHVVNVRGLSQRILMYWLPQGRSGVPIAPRAIELPSANGFASEDFVASVLLQQGIGAIEFVGVTAEGEPDPNARLHVTSRIWTPRPDGAIGTLSQTFPALVMPGSTARVKTVLGMPRSEQYRLNVGVANPTQTLHRFRVTTRIITATNSEVETFEFDVQPRSIEQRNIVMDLEGSSQVHIENLSGMTTDWQAWVSSIDNESGDAWSQIAFPFPPGLQ
ncbi:MAG TPA: hypothetical protein VFV49_05520 [Thermoanaerobaculia bacterium]|nr:hypothetical protein [Thermoanaerobaculia bacterium]